MVRLTDSAALVRLGIYMRLDFTVDLVQETFYQEMLSSHIRDPVWEEKRHSPGTSQHDSRELVDEVRLNEVRKSH